MTIKKITQYNGDTINLEALAEAVKFLGPLIIGSNWQKYNFWFRIVKLPSQYDGQCWKEKNQIHIRLDSKLSFIDMILTLSHELIHAKQYLTGKLKAVPNNYTGVWVWKGKVYRKTITNYDSLPWELEAKAKEHIFAKKFFENSIKTLKGNNSSYSKRYNTPGKNTKEIII